MDRVCHFEIPYEDRERAAKFYQDVFGWQVMEVPDMTYSFAITTPTDEEQKPLEPGGINGGMYERAEGASSTPVVVMEVDSTEQRIKDVEAAGGSMVIPATNIGDMGVYAQVKDSEGNIVGLWQSLKG
ncbi:MAG: VOC family protein [Pirellulaceae bacterium]|jgi:hypothetical protein|nr:VOC family protein [Pirellulaceae bacterium]MDP7017967.1 VOC family protein [Pirellulaceae bacterium]